MDQMRIEKETEIKNLEIKIEEDRSTYELQINELELNLHNFEQMKIKADA